MQKYVEIHQVRRLVLTITEDVQCLVKQNVYKLFLGLVGHSEIFSTKYMDLPFYIDHV